MTQDTDQWAAKKGERCGTCRSWNPTAGRELGFGGCASRAVVQCYPLVFGKLLFCRERKVAFGVVCVRQCVGRSTVHRAGLASH